VTTAAPEYTVHLRGAGAKVYDDKTRFRVWVAGAGSGKTHHAINECILDAGDHPGHDIRFVAPTRDMALDPAWLVLKALLPPEWIKDKNETRLEVTLVNGSRIRLCSADNPDSLRGTAPDFVVFDECREIDAYAWEGAVRPRMAKRPGSRALFITTPNGFDWTYDLYLKGQEHHEGEWSSHLTTTVEGGWITPEEIEKARRDMDPRLFRQEFLATFETMEGRVYPSFSRRPWPEGNLDADAKDDGGEILCGMDFNVNPMSFVLGSRAVDQLLIWDAIELPTSNTEEVAQYLRNRFGDRAIVVCPDPTGNAHKTSAAAGQTDFTILRRYGMVIDAQRAAPPVRDRINNTNANLEAAGQRRVRVHPSSTPLIKALEGLVYTDTGTNQPDKKSGLDHITDALGYLTWQRFNLLHRRAAAVSTLGL
jgi:hypothetical protein